MRSLFASLLVALFANIASAQQAANPSVFDGPDAQIQTSILTLDLDRLFVQSAYGRRIAETYSVGRAELEVENRGIFDALRDEELALAAQRPDMAPDAFLAEADAFDQKAQEIRRAQDAKGAALESFLTDGREQFLEVARPIIGRIMVEQGASAVLDRRSVFLSLSTVDITDIALGRINAAIGDGRSLGDAATSGD